MSDIKFKSTNKSVVRKPVVLHPLQKELQAAYGAYCKHLLCKPDSLAGESEQAEYMMKDHGVPAYCHDIARKVCANLITEWTNQFEHLSKQIAMLTMSIEDAKKDECEWAAAMAFAEENAN